MIQRTNIWTVGLRATNDDPKTCQISHISLCNLFKKNAEIAKHIPPRSINLSVEEANYDKNRAASYGQGTSDSWFDLQYNFGNHLSSFKGIASSLRRTLNEAALVFYSDTTADANSCVDLDVLNRHLQQSRQEPLNVKCLNLFDPTADGADEQEAFFRFLEEKNVVYPKDTFKSPDWNGAHLLAQAIRNDARLTQRVLDLDTPAAR